MRLSKCVAVMAVLSGWAILCSPLATKAAEVLVNGGLEVGAGPQGWTLTQSVSSTSPVGDFNGNGVVDGADYVLWRNNDGTSNALPNDNGLGTPIGAAHYNLWRSSFGNVAGAGGSVAATELVDSAQEGFPGNIGLGLLVKPYAGNVGVYAGQNKAVNLSMSQTFVAGPSAAGKIYTFSGDSQFQSAYSGNIDNLFSDSPSGVVPSPTQTKFEIAFLNSSNALIGSPFSVDLPRNRVDTDPPTWQMSQVSATAPAGTFNIRVTASATNMVASCTSACPGGQDLKFDNFTLRDNISAATERLTNGTLNTPGSPASWTLQTVGNDAVQFSNGSFAVHSGNVGMWLRSFQGNNASLGNGPIDATILQTVPATAGASYTYSAWAKLQPAFSGLDPSSGTHSFITMEFLNGSTPIGTPVTVDLGSLSWSTGMDNQGDWQQVSLPTSVAPPGTTSIRVSGGATGMISESVRFPGIPQSAMFDDFSLIMAGSGSGNLLSGVFAAAAVPEPASVWLFAAGISAVLGVRRRNG